MAVLSDHLTHPTTPFHACCITSCSLNKLPRPLRTLSGYTQIIAFKSTRDVVRDSQTTALNSGSLVTMMWGVRVHAKIPSGHSELVTSMPPLPHHFTLHHAEFIGVLPHHFTLHHAEFIGVLGAQTSVGCISGQPAMTLSPSIMARHSTL